MPPIIFEPTPRRIRVEFNKVMIADSTRAMIEIETPIPVYYLPLADIRPDLLAPSDHTSFDQRRGSARFWSIAVGDRRAENAVWNYPQPLPGAPALAPYAAFKWDHVDHWYEEDEEIFRHARNPYKRVDAIHSTRRPSPGSRMHIFCPVTMERRRRPLSCQKAATPRFAPSS